MLGEALNYLGSALEKPGRAVRGVLSGNLREGLAAVPFSDSMGLTDPSQRVTGRNLTDNWGVTRRGDKGWGSWALGTGTDIATDPLSYLPMHSVFKALRPGDAAAHGLTAGRAASGGETFSASFHPNPINTEAREASSLANNASRTRRFSTDPAKAGHYAADRADRFSRRFGFGGASPQPKTPGETFNASLGLKYDNQKGVFPSVRATPEYINNRTWYHGSGTPGLTAGMIDPMKTSPDNLFGRGIYTTASEDLGKSYLDKGVGDAIRSLISGSHSREYAAASNPELSSHMASFFSDRFHGLHDDDKAGLIYRLAMQAARGDGPAEQAEIAKRAFGAVFPGKSLPARSFYQAQSDFGHILDLDAPLSPDKYQHLFDALDPVARNIRSADPLHDRPSLATMLAGENGGIKAVPNGGPMSPESLVIGAKKLGQYGGYEPTDLLLKGLREAGYDAMIHTGGTRAGAGKTLHQVLIGLDPNDVLGLGRKTPYQRWEQFNGSLGRGGTHPGLAGPDGGVADIAGHVPGPAQRRLAPAGGLDTSLRPAREGTAIFKAYPGKATRAPGWESSGKSYEELAAALGRHRGIREEFPGQVGGISVPPWSGGAAAGTSSVFNPAAAREEILHAMTSHAAHSGNIGDLPALARPAAYAYRMANRTGSKSIRGLGSVLDELSAKTMAERTTKGKLGAAMNFLLDPRAHLDYDPQFAQHGLLPRAAYHTLPYAIPAGAAGAAGYALSRE